MYNDLISVNGKITDAAQAALEAKDPGLLFGYGIFETLRVYNTIPFMLKDHLERLKKSLEKLEIVLPASYCFEEEIRKFVQHIELINGVLRITVTKGSKKPNIILTHREVGYTAVCYEKGLSLKTSSIKRNASSPLTYLKTLNYMDNILAKKEALEAGFDEALMTNTEGLISECSTSNIFFISDQVLYTPERSCGLLNGIAKQFIINTLAQELSLTTIEGQYPLKVFLRADEIFISNSIMQVMPVIKINDQLIGTGTPGPITQKIITQYERHIQSLYL